TLCDNCMGIVAERHNAPDIGDINRQTVATCAARSADRDRNRGIIFCRDNLGTGGHDPAGICDADYPAVTGCSAVASHGKPKGKRAFRGSRERVSHRRSACPAAAADAEGHNAIGHNAGRRDRTGLGNSHAATVSRRAAVTIDRDRRIDKVAAERVSGAAAATATTRALRKDRRGKIGMTGDCAGIVDFNNAAHSRRATLAADGVVDNGDTYITAITTVTAAAARALCKDCARTESGHGDHAEIFDEEVAAVARGRAVTTNRHGARRRGRDGGCRASVPSATADALRENAGAGDARRCDRGVRIVDDGDVTAFTALATVATNGDKTGSAATITAAATDAFGIDAIGPVAARDNAAVVGDIDGSAIATGVAAATECDYGARMTAGATAAADAGRGDGVRKVAAGADGAAVGNVNETAIRSSA